MPPKINNSTLKHRFETEVGARTAFLNYRIAGSQITFTHTEVPAALQGRGLGVALVKAGLDYAAANNLRVVPQCSFVAEFLSTHPQYQRLVTPGAE